MTRGLVIGKFLPIHQGHVALIDFAAHQCDELIVSMSYTSGDPISAEVRFHWIVEIFKDRPAIKPAMILDDFDDENLPLSERTRKWSEVIRRTYPPVNIIFSSEAYGDPFAVSLGAIHTSFDPERKLYPVSASRIRQNPFQYWDYIPSVVRPHFVKKICLYGPESTGKTTLASHLAKLYETEFVPEVAREFISTSDFTLQDIIATGEAHLSRIEEKVKVARKILICDTDVITTQIYSRYYLNAVPDILYDLEDKVKYDRYFLFDIDVPWIPDGLRNLGNRREHMMDVFKEELIRRAIPFVFVSGSFGQREEIIRDEIDRMLG